MKNRIAGLVALFALVALAAGCAAGKAFSAGETAMKAGNLDEAVAEYRKAVQADPENTTYKIGLQRAMQSLCENNVLGIVANGARASELYSKYTYYYSKVE